MVEYGYKSSRTADRDELNEAWTAGYGEMADAWAVLPPGTIILAPLPLDGLIRARRLSLLYGRRAPGMSRIATAVYRVIESGPPRDPAHIDVRLKGFKRISPVRSSSVAGVGSALVMARHNHDFGADLILDSRASAYYVAVQAGDDLTLVSCAAPTSYPWALATGYAAVPQAQFADFPTDLRVSGAAPLPIAVLRSARGVYLYGSATSD